MWPNARIAVMGGEQAAQVLVTVKQDQGKSNGDTARHERLREDILQKYETESSAYFSTSRLWDDGVIDPAQTRDIVGMALSVTMNRKFGEPRTGIFRM